MQSETFLAALDALIDLLRTERLQAQDKAEQIVEDPLAEGDARWLDGFEQGLLSAIVSIKVLRGEVELDASCDSDISEKTD